MQALDFKAETEKRCDLLLGTVQSVIGFIPNAVRSHISFLRLLKAPGDPQYDLYRSKSLQQSSFTDMGPDNNGPPSSPSNRSSRNEEDDENAVEQRLDWGVTLDMSNSPKAGNTTARRPASASPAMRLSSGHR
eukprot:gene1972-2337_t